MDSRGRAPACAGWCGLGRSLVCKSNCGVLLQFVEVAVGHNIARINAFDLCSTAVCNSWLYGAQMSDIILDQIHERCLAILLNCGGWKQRHPLQGIHQQPSVHELVREKRIILIVEDG